MYVNHELTNSRSNRTPKLYDRIVKLRNEHLRFRIPEIAQNIHPNKQESKVRKLLPEASKNRKSQFPEQREIGGKSKRSYQGELESLKEFQEDEKARWEAQLQYSQDQVRNRDHIMNEALVQVRGVAEHLQTLAVQANVISVQTELESTRGKRLASLLKEIKSLSLKAKRYM
ncbi:hypothetical protein GQ457_08G026830 [Hibiscus cannabinus]